MMFKKIVFIAIIGFVTILYCTHSLYRENSANTTTTASSLPTKIHIDVNSIACYRIKDYSLPDVADLKPKKGKAIFFHETSCKSYAMNGTIRISAREACAVESAALTNPNYDVHLLFASPGVIGEDRATSNKFVKTLLRYYANIKMYHIDYETYTKNTPVENLYRKRAVESSKYALSHASDVLRYLTLWKYGGIYLDLDVVVLKPFDELHANFAGSESDEHVAAGVLRFEPEGKGHRFARECLEDLRDHFRGDDWGYNGPGVIQRLLQKLCKVKWAKDMINGDCEGLKVYPPATFYPVPWQNWSMYFEAKYDDEIAKISGDSYTIHAWNKKSEGSQIPIDSNVPYSNLARRYCPRVFAECDKYF